MPASEPPFGTDTTAAEPIRPTGLKRRSVLLMFALTIVSFGLYYPIWFLRRRAALNRLDSPRKLQRWPFLCFIALAVVQTMLAIAFSPASFEQAIGAGPALLLSLARFAVGIVILVQCFFIKDILEDHLAGPGDNLPGAMLSDRVILSGLMTFFFQMFYLQHIINRHIVGSRSRATPI
jgi:hypothetical protein